MIYSIQPSLVKHRYRTDISVYFNEFVNYEKLFGRAYEIKNIVTDWSFDLPKDVVGFEGIISILGENLEYQIEDNAHPVLAKVGKELCLAIVEFTDSGSELQIKAEEKMKNSRASCLGGTFDSMHLGHKLFLSLGAMSSKKLLVGVT